MPEKRDPAKKREATRKANLRAATVDAKALAIAERLEAAEKSINRPLTERQQKFVEGILNGMAPVAAARYAGVQRHAQSASCHMANSLAVQRAIEKGRADYEKANMMTKKRVMDGFLEAIDVARLQADSVAMTGGWREIAKMCGYYEPTRHKLEVSVNGQVVIQKLQSLNDEQLLQLADGQADALDGEFEVVS
jgi:phage terminase small subunit